MLHRFFVQRGEACFACKSRSGQTFSSSLDDTEGVVKSINLLHIQLIQPLSFFDHMPPLDDWTPTEIRYRALLQALCPEVQRPGKPEGDKTGGNNREGSSGTSC